MIYASSHSFNFSYTCCCCFFSLVIFSCSSSPDPQYSQIPFVNVNKRIDLSSISGGILMQPNRFLYSSGGYAGLVIYHSGNNEYVTYDRACPYDYKQKTAIITYMPFAFKFVCPLCKTEYNTSGQVIKLPGIFPLQPYPTYYDASANTLSIAN